jgi:hypothetical protein
MQQFFNGLLQFLQQGIAAIFKFVGQIWAWVVGEIHGFINLPWNALPLWKLILAGVIAAAAGALLYKAAHLLWDSFEKILRDFAALLSSLVVALPWAVGAGLILWVGLWIIRTF